MDLTPQARDIEELIAAFAEKQGTELAQMKELWRSRDFSFIHEAKPKDVISSFYAQGLFSSALIHIVGEESLHWKVGALYVLYILHGTQLQEAACRIYLSLEELEALHSLVKEMNKKGLTTALVVVRKMFAENMFLFGSVSANQKRIATTVAKLAKQADSRVRQARSRLLTNVPMETHVTGRLSEELGLQDLAQLAEEYAGVKTRALLESTGGEMVVNGLEDGGTVGAEITTLGADLMKDAASWEAQKRELLAPSQPQSNELALSTNSTVVGLESPKTRSSREIRQKTITEYEKELSERNRMSEFERELVKELDLALENDD